MKSHRIVFFICIFFKLQLFIFLTSCRLAFQKHEAEEPTSNKEWYIFLTEPKSGEPDLITEKDKSTPEARLSITRFENGGLQWTFVENPLHLEYISYEICRTSPDRFCINDISFENMIRIPSLRAAQALHYKSRACKESGPGIKRESYCGPWSSSSVKVNKVGELNQKYFWDQYHTIVRLKELGSLNIELLKTFLVTEHKSFNSTSSYEKVLILKRMIRIFLQENNEISLLALSETGSAIPWKIISGAFGRNFLTFNVNTPDFSKNPLRSPDLLQNMEDICTSRPVLNYCLILTMPDQIRQNPEIQSMIKNYQFFIGENNVASEPGSPEHLATYLRFASEHQFFARLPKGYFKDPDFTYCLKQLPESICSDPIAIWSISRDLRGTLSALNQHFLMSRAITLMIHNLKKEPSMGIWSDKYLKNLNYISSQYLKLNRNSSPEPGIREGTTPS